jgi:indole-3-glycerol phosphate synthase
MNILDEIIEHKKLEVGQRQVKTPLRVLENSPLFRRKGLSLKQSLLDESKSGIIAEFKRQSPSRGIINPSADAFTVTSAYSRYGASGLSVLTDSAYFGGSSEDLIQARANDIPILRKDFIIDGYQIIESKAIGADAILLIAACLTPREVRLMAEMAKKLQLEVLLEIHSEEELEHICEETELVGVNNRDLKTFTVDINLSIILSKKIASEKIKIAESGITNTDTICQLKKFGYKGFLIGETFMREPDPAIAFASFVNRLKNSTK